ncbi:MAG: tyrosine-type recombinase/integrase [Kiritimatiellia bacterium]
MKPDPVVPSSPGKPSTMGRKRTANHDLPPRMTRKGSAYYYVCNSKPRKWIPLGTDLARAKRRWAELDTPEQTGILVADLVQTYVDREDRPHSTLLQYASYQRQIAKDFAIPAAQLRSQHVALWRELPAQRVRKTYVNGVIGLLVSAFKLGHELGLCDLVSVGKWQLEGRDRVLSPAEYLRIRGAAAPWLQIAMDIGYLTGARPSDIRALRWERVGERVALRQIKTGLRQEFTINPDLAGVLQQARQRPICGLFVVANDKGRPISRDVWSRAWLAACKSAAVEDAQFRDIRAMAAKAAEAGGQDYQSLLGHTTRQMSNHYLKGRRTVVADPVRQKL